MRSESILFDQLIASGTSNLRLTRELPFPGRVRELTMVFYPGQQKTLQVTPFLYRAPDIYVPLSKYAGTRSYFSGDDAKFEIAMSMAFGRYDSLGVIVSNVSDPAADYNLYVLYELEYGKVN